MREQVADSVTPQGTTNRRVLLRPRGGQVFIAEGAAPSLGDGEVLIQTRYSVISRGTEQAKLELAERGLVAKARSRPDLVRQALEHLSREGIGATARAIRARLAEPMPLGYSSAGTVIATGSRVEGLSFGDVVAAGGGQAIHADVVAVPRNLVARVPDGVPVDAAAFTTLGAVATHAFRQSQASVGDTVAVIGLGLIGLLTGGVARAAGCRVVGVDIRPDAQHRARASGFEFFEAGADCVRAVRAATGGRGADVVLLCAASKSGEPLEVAAGIARDRARLVVVGDMPIAVPRDVLYDKELEVTVSRSYGPGRYDSSYEEHGHDYPIGYVRWTERRNMESFLQLLAQSRIDVLSLITDRYPVDRASEAYQAITTPGSVALFEYEARGRIDLTKTSRTSGGPAPAGRLGVGVIGTGSFAQRIVLPILRDASRCQVVATASMRGGGDQQPEALIADPDVDAVVITSRHDTHAELVRTALEAGKPVFVEKPVALTRAELLAVTASWQATSSPAMVGFNRRFAPMAIHLRRALAARTGPALISMRINAGMLAPDHWTLDLDVGGGRIVGELCHFIDLAAFLLDSRPTQVWAQRTGDGSSPQAAQDVATTIRHADGSLSSVIYTALGESKLGKERIEAFAEGDSYVIEDWRRLTTWHDGRSTATSSRPNKGHAAELNAFLEAAAGDRPSIDDEFARSLSSMSATLSLIESLSLGLPIDL